MSTPMKRILPYLFAGVGVALICYFLAKDCPAPVAVKVPQTCEEKRAAAEDLAGRLRNAEALVDSCEAAEPTPSPATPVG